MTDLTLESVVIAIVGAGMLVSGMAAWTGRWRSWTDFPFLFSPSATFAPAGAGLLIAALLELIQLRTFAAASLALVGVGAVMTIWQPRWSYPPWFRHRLER